MAHDNGDAGGRATGIRPALVLPKAALNALSSSC